MICSCCGANQPVSSGLICAFCKSPLGIGAQSPLQANLAQFTRFYETGDLERGATFAQTLSKDHPEVLNNADFIMQFVKLLIEVDGPTTQITTLIHHALILNPASQEALNYLEIVAARDHLTPAPNDAGEQKLRAVLKIDPRNVHALFFLASHFFWMEKDVVRPVPLLEACVRIRPAFKRAWGCLAALYAQSGNSVLHSRALERCLSLETRPESRETLTTVLARLKAAS